MAETHDIIIEQNATFTKVFTWVDMDAYKAAIAAGSSESAAATAAAINVTGYTAQFVVKASKDTVIGSALVNVSSSSGGTGDTSGILVGGTNGTFTVVLSKATTAALAVGEAVYDLKIVSTTGVATRLVEGSVAIDPGVTP